MDQELPQTMGYEAAAVVDEIGADVADVAIGDRVFGFSSDGGAQAELAVLSYYASIPPSLDFAAAVALPSALETAARALDQLGVEPVAYGDGMAERIRALAPGGVDLALDVSGSGVLPELIELAGGPKHVITVADFASAQQYDVRFSRGDTGRALYALDQIGDLIESGQFSFPVGQTFPLADVGDAHRVGEAGRVRGKLVLLVD
jgi:NADPH:quinone reductase-like Zn-dependent oxidoreductase